jgi:hypothetical protein
VAAAEKGVQDRISHRTAVPCCKHKNENVIVKCVFVADDIEMPHPNMHEKSTACGDVFAAQINRFGPNPGMFNYTTLVAGR